MPVKKNHRLLLFCILLIVVFITAVGLYAGKRQQDHGVSIAATTIPIDGTVLPKPRRIGAFHMSDNRGRSFDNAQLQGHWTLLFFGFTHCGYVCPTSLAELSKMYSRLASQLPHELMPEVILVSVDPERDSVKRLNEYVKAFNPHFRALRGTLAQTKILAQQLSVVFDKVPMANSNYSVTHSAEVLLINPEGNLQAFLSYPHHAEQLAHDYLTVVHTLNNPEENKKKEALFSLEKFRGKWVFINYWATWCSSCKKEIPAFVEFQKTYQNTVVVLGVNYDHLQGEALSKAMKQYHITYPVLAQDPESALRWATPTVLPTTYVINPQGQVTQQLIGPQTITTLKAAMQA
ncbi:MAG: hypothetical protein A3F41_01380 [Coxiella sp. RIFCSPHIGHO2_12_FULL_44_14]|nr:MAG: hypothetical protein A3F41_01380 [Coxiella sp. RIFCSPHIGHO2_12_FULL_44_14]